LKRIPFGGYNDVFSGKKEDPADDLFIACAIEGEAKFIISRDHHLRSLKTFQGITILDPTSFLKTINKKT